MAFDVTKVALPLKLIEEIDALVGFEGRSKFMEEAVRDELRRRRALTVDQNPTSQN